jgi:hypothetical protein
MLISKDNDGKPFGFAETLTSIDRVVTVNQTRNAATVTTRDRANGEVRSVTLYGNLLLLKKD